MKEVMDDEGALVWDFEVPEGWAQVPLSELTTNRSGNGKLIKGKLSNHYTPKTPYPGFSASGQDVWLDSYDQEGNAIIISSVGARCGKAFEANGKWSAIANTHVVRPNEAVLHSKLFWYLINDEKFWVRGGSAQPFVKVNKTFERSFALPPLAEQKRIADKLEAVLGRVDACRARLDRVPDLLKRFRQSVLAAATSGQLTEDWRTENSGADVGTVVSQIAEEQELAGIKVRGGRVEPGLNDLQQDIELPTGWAVIGFDALAEPAPNALKAGPFGSALKKDMYSLSGFKIYGQEQVIAGDETFGDYFIDQQKFEELSSCAVKPGDILISLVGTIGKVLILSPCCKPGIINPRLVKLSLHECICREYVAVYLRSPIAQTFFTSKSHGGTMDILNLGLLRELPILLPPLAEQAEIVRRVEALFALADRIETRLTAARAQVERLTPATLAKAFRGELVPQDPGDEPASKLLERVRVSSAKAAKPKFRKP